MIIFACTFNLLSIHIQTPDHIILFSSISISTFSCHPLPSQASQPFQYKLCQWSSASLSSSLILYSLLSSPRRTHKRKHAHVYGACHTTCPLLPRKRQYILLYGLQKFPILYCVWELHSCMVLHLWCMTMLTILHLLCSRLRVTRAVQKSRLWQQGSLYIFLSVWLPLCIPSNAFCLHSAVWEYS